MLIFILTVLSGRTASNVNTTTLPDLHWHFSNLRPICWWFWLYYSLTCLRELQRDWISRVDISWITFAFCMNATQDLTYDRKFWAPNMHHITNVVIQLLLKAGIVGVNPKFHVSNVESGINRKFLTLLPSHPTMTAQELLTSYPETSSSASTLYFMLLFVRKNIEFKQKMLISAHIIIQCHVSHGLYTSKFLNTQEDLKLSQVPKWSYIYIFIYA